MLPAETPLRSIASRVIRFPLIRSRMIYAASLNLSASLLEMLTPGIVPHFRARQVGANPLTYSIVHANDICRSVPPSTLLAINAFAVNVGR